VIRRAIDAAPHGAAVPPYPLPIRSSSSAIPPRPKARRNERGCASANAAGIFGFDVILERIAAQHGGPQHFTDDAALPMGGMTVRPLRAILPT